MLVQPYLFFNGRCEEALEFYRKALGAEVVMLMRFKECPEPTAIPPGAENKIMHMSLRIGETVVMASDGQCEGEGPAKTNFQGFSLSLSAANEAEAKKLFTALSDGGEVRMPLAKTFFASSFGMVADRFGVGWMIIVAAQ